MASPPVPLPLMSSDAFLPHPVAPGSAPATAAVPAAATGPVQSPPARSGRRLAQVLAVALAQAPESAAYGLMALAPLGPALGPTAMGLALLGAVVANAVAAATGAGGLITAPRAALALLTAALLSHLQTLGGGRLEAPLLLGLLALGLVGAAALQGLFGALRLGTVVKFTPHPVRVGVMSGVGLLLVGHAWPTLLGQGLGGGWQGGWAAVKPGAVVVAAAAMAVLHLGARRPLAVPAVLLALAVGALLQAGLAALGVAVGPTAGVPQLPQPWFWQVSDWAALRSGLDTARLATPVLSALAVFAGTAAALSALDTLLAASVVDGRLRQSRDANRELRAQGLANLAAALVGGLANSPSVQRSLALVQAWPSPRRAVAGYALALLALLALAPQLLGWLPVSAIGGVLVLQGLQTVDPWLWRTPQALRRLGRSTGYDPAQRRLLLDNWGVAATVVACSLLLGLAVAVLVGAAFSVLLFVRANMRSVVRVLHRGDSRRSLKVRSPDAAAALRREGRRIAVLELQGALFFGTADSLRDALAALAPEVDSAVLDLYLVGEVDATGARILLELADEWARRGKSLVASEWPAGDARRGVVEAIARSNRLPLLTFVDDSDQALQRAEDALLTGCALAAEGAGTLALADTLLAQGLGAADLATLAGQMQTLHFRQGQRLFAAGDVADALYVSLRGHIGVHLPGQARRLASFAPGVMVGELAVIEHGRRSADAVAESDLTVLCLSLAALDHLQQQHPALAAQLLRNVALHLAGRLRGLTLELQAWVARSAALPGEGGFVTSPASGSEPSDGV